MDAEREKAQEAQTNLGSMLLRGFERGEGGNNFGGNGGNQQPGNMMNNQQPGNMMGNNNHLEISNRDKE